MIPDPKGVSHYYVDVKAVGINGKPVVVSSLCVTHGCTSTVHVAEP